MKITHNMFAFVSSLTILLALPMAASAVPGGLGATVAVSRIHFQPPAGYAKRNGPAPSPGSVLCAWIGAGRPDGSRPTLEMMVYPIPVGQSARATPTFLTKNFLEGTKRLTENWQATPPQVVQIHGLHFYRTYWAGKDIQTGFAMQGVQYVARDGDRVIVFGSQDPEKDGTDGIRLAQAAILTVHKGQ